MRRFLPPLAVSLFALFAAQPLFIRQLTCSDDGFFHIAKAVTLEALIRAGHFFGRWSPHMAHGYGYPYFNYYGPLASYVLIALHNLGLIYPVALHVFFALCLWLAGLAAYAFVREWLGEAAGVAAAVVYLTAPYLAFDILYRAALAETFALVWPPIILFTLHRALVSVGRGQSAVGSEQSNGTRIALHASRLSFVISHFWSLGFGIWDLLAALSFAALLYTHNATSLAVAPLAAGYVLLLATSKPQRHTKTHEENLRAPSDAFVDQKTLLRGGLILALGLALSARFWLPAILESNLVQTDRLLVPPIFTYYTNYLSLGELLAPPAAIDPLLINPSPAKALGLVAALLALVGFAALAYRSPAPPLPRSLAPSLAFGIWVLGFGISYSILTLPFTRPIWDHVPLLPFIQFPWRLLGPASLCAAVLAGAGVHWLPKHQWSVAAAIALTASLGHLSWWYPRYCGEFQEVDLARTIQYEYDTYTLGTSAKGEFLPTTVRLVPEDNSIAQAIIRGETPQYLTGLPADSQLTVTDSDPLDYRASISLPNPARITFNQFYFPGWRAAIDDHPADIQLTPDTGLITVLIPQGTHALHFYFGDTPIRALGDTLSFISIIALIALLSLSPPLPIPPAPPPPRSPAPPLGFGLWILGFALLILRPLLIDRTLNPLRHSAFDGTTVSIGSPINAALSGGLNVLSAEYPAIVQSGSDFDVILYLAPRRQVNADYRPRFDLSTTEGLIWNDGNEALPPRWHKEPPGTQYWLVGQYAQWARREIVLPGTPPGDYQLTATIFDLATLAPDSVIDAVGNFASPGVSLGAVHVTRPASPPAVSDLNIQYRADHDLGPITLLGYNLDRAEARPGDSVLITLFVRADEKMTDDLFFTIGNAGAGLMPALVSGDKPRPYVPPYPTSQWQVGDVWRLQTLARIPAEAESGPYQFALSFGGSAIALAPIQLSAPQRIFTAPFVVHRTAIRFGNWIELAGYTLRAADDSITLDLVWRALAAPDADLSAFVHVEDSSGRIVAQSDGVPANWSRPTTGWLAGEYVIDSRMLAALPSGEYTVYVGFADRVTGIRLPTAEGGRAAIGVYKVP